MAMKNIFYFMCISLVSGRPFHPPRDLPGASNHPHGVKIPLYMINLYQTLMENNKNNHRAENHILQESDTVQSLTAKNFTVEDNRWSLTFDLSSISRNDELRMVELQVHLPPLTKSKNVTVDIYHVNNDQDKLFIGSVTTNIPSKQDSSWTTFNVTEMMENSLLWGKNLTNHGDGDVKSVEMSEHEIKKRDVPLHEISTDQAIIVFFTKHKSFSKPETPSLIKKLAENIISMAAFRRHKRTKSESQQTTPSNIDPIVVEQNKPSYRKMDSVVDTKKITSKYKIHPSLRGPVLLY
ncbi:nodal homolog 3-A-like [Rhinoderma darwinii]|uniref:nodal homolog 3-A-like n=1 Tax=Rhinoderma darwinii TaxID=43563 RepID=UPI003F67790C